MIDYEKLKALTDLIHNHAQSCNESSTLEFLYYGSSEFERYKWNSYSYGEHVYRNIDEIISKVKELTQPEKPKPKYKLNDILWIYDYENSQIRSFIIDAISLKNLRYSGTIVQDDSESNDCYEEVPESHLYPSRESLIDAQIEYWTNLKIDKISASKTCPKCGMQRVADGMCWAMACDYRTEQ